MRILDYIGKERVGLTTLNKEPMVQNSKQITTRRGFGPRSFERMRSTAGKPG